MKRFPLAERRVHWLVELWIVQVALDRFVAKKLNPKELREVWKVTRKPEVVTWPEWQLMMARQACPERQLCQRPWTHSAAAAVDQLRSFAHRPQNGCSQQERSFERYKQDDANCVNRRSWLQRVLAGSSRDDAMVERSPR